MPSSETGQVPPDTEQRQLHAETKQGDGEWDARPLDQKGNLLMCIELGCGFRSKVKPEVE